VILSIAEEVIPFLAYYNRAQRGLLAVMIEAARF